MHSLQKYLIENPNKLEGIENAILYRKGQLKKSFSYYTYKSIKAEEEAVKKYKTA